MGLGLFIVLSLTCLGLVIWHEATDGETVGALSALLSVLERMAAVLVTLSLSIYASVEGAAMLYEKYAKRRFQEGKPERDREWTSIGSRRREEASQRAGEHRTVKLHPRINPSKNGQDNALSLGLAIDEISGYHRRRRGGLWHRVSGPARNSRHGRSRLSKLGHGERGGGPPRLCHRVSGRWPSTGRSQCTGSCRSAF